VHDQAEETQGGKLRLLRPSHSFPHIISNAHAALNITAITTTSTTTPTTTSTATATAAATTTTTTTTTTNRHHNRHILHH
jgi:hypothetical protein